MATLTHDEILTLHAAIIGAQLIGSRSALLAGIDSSVVAGLVLASTPSDQVLHDLDALNTIGTLADGTIPLHIWLKNAVARTAGRLENSVFVNALHRIAPTPVTSIIGDSAAPADKGDTATLTALREAYQHGRLIVFAGAGVSSAAGLPSDPRLVELMLEHMRRQRTSEEHLSEVQELAAQGHYLDAMVGAQFALGTAVFVRLVTAALDDGPFAVPDIARALTELAPKSA